MVEPLFFFLGCHLLCFCLFLFLLRKTKCRHLWAGDLWERLRTCLAVRSLLGSEGFLFRFGIGLQDLVSEILWAEKSKLASQGPTRECGKA